MSSLLGCLLLDVSSLLDLFIDALDANTADGLFRVGTLVFGVLSLCLGLSLVIVTQVASLAHTDGVVQLVSVFTVPGSLVSTELSIAGRAHVLGIMLSVNVWTLGDLHDIRLGLWLIPTTGLCLISTAVVVRDLVVCFFSGQVSDLNGRGSIIEVLDGFFVTLLVVDVFLLKEILQQLCIELTRWIRF